MHGLQPCGALVACGRRLFLQAISPPFLVVSNSTKKHDVGRVFFNVCKVFCTHLHNFFEIVRGACRLRSMPFLASNPSSSLAVSSSLNIVSSRRIRRVFFNLCKICLHKFVRFISKIARGVCRLRSAIENTSCSHRLLLPAAALWSILS